MSYDFEGVRTCICCGVAKWTFSLAENSAFTKIFFEIAIQTAFSQDILPLEILSDFNSAMIKKNTLIKLLA